MSKRSCIFCGSGPVTREHVFGRWIQRMAPADGPRSGSITFHTPGRARERFFEAPPLGRTARVVCARCNSGWMSVLENEAAPVLATLFTGHSGRLAEEHLTILSKWAFKTALVIDAASLDGNGPLTPSAHREAFARNQELPDMSAVWLTTWPGTTTTWTAHWGLEIGDGPRAVSTGVNTYGATIAIFPIVFRTYTTGASAVHPDRVRDRLPGISRIWPVEGPLDWEARFWLTAQQLEDFAFDIPRAIEGDRDAAGFWHGEDPGPLRGPI